MSITRRALVYIAFVLTLLTPLSAAAQGSCGRPSCVYLPFVQRADIANVTPPVAADQLQVRSVTTRRPSATSLYLVGELVNPTAAPAYSARITARFLDAAGALVATEDAFAFLSQIAPGGRAPFRVILSNPPATIAAYSLSLSSSQGSALAYRAGAVLSQATRDNFGVEVFGDVRNPEAFELRSVVVAATFYDIAGGVVDVDRSFTSPLNLPAGATAPYSIKTFEDLIFASFSVHAEGYLPP